MILGETTRTQTPFSGSLDVLLPPLYTGWLLCVWKRERESVWWIVSSGSSWYRAVCEEAGVPPGQQYLTHTPWFSVYGCSED